MITGTVKFFNADKGYGFIAQNRRRACSEQPSNERPKPSAGVLGHIAPPECDLGFVEIVTCE